MGVIGALHHNEMTPPLYFILEHAWIAIAGTSEAAMRVPSLICAMLTVATMYLLGLRIASRVAAALAAAIAALCPVFVSAGMEARAYGLTVLLSALTLYACVLVSQAQSRRQRLRYVAALAVLLTALDATNFTGFVILAALAAYACVWALFARTANAAALFVSTLAAAVLSTPVLQLLRQDSAHFRGVVHLYRDPLQLLDDHLGVFSPFGSMISQTNRAIELGLLLWVLSTVARRRFEERDRWIALCVAILATGIAVSALRHLSLERHLLAYGPAAWLVMALLADAYLSWLWQASRRPVLLWKAVTVAVGLYVAGGAIARYPAVYAKLRMPLSGSRVLVSALQVRQGRTPTLLVALPDNVAPDLSYYVRTDPGIALRGVATWCQPQWYGIYDRTPWLVRNFVDVQAGKIEGYARERGTAIALAILPDPGNYNGMPFYRARNVGAALEKREGVAYRRLFYGWREPLELVVLRSGRLARSPVRRCIRSVRSRPSTSCWKPDIRRMRRASVRTPYRSRP